jgi:hypothetical protein
MSNFEDLRLINVNDHIETKNGLSYLSWSWAWDKFKQMCPDATYSVAKNQQGLPYFESNAGAIVFTSVTARGETHEMWLPVMDGANRAMKAAPYSYTTNRGERTVAAYDMFDINKTIMRCFVKNLAMFGLGLYIFHGEAFPEHEIEAPARPESFPSAVHELAFDVIALSREKPESALQKIYAAKLDKEQEQILIGLLDPQTTNRLKEAKESYEL